MTGSERPNLPDERMTVVSGWRNEWMTITSQRCIGYKDLSVRIATTMTVSRIDVVGDVSPEALLAYVDKYCREHPLNKLWDAAKAFIIRDR